MGQLGNALNSNGRYTEALPVIEASLAFRRRWWSHEEEFIRTGQCHLAACLGGLGRYDEALVLYREIYAREVATLGVSHEHTIGTSCNIANALVHLKLLDDAKKMYRDQVLPAARRSLGADHNFTLIISRNLAIVLYDDLERTRDDLLEAETILQDVVQRRRRVFGPTHPETLRAEQSLSIARARLARA